MPSYLIKAVRSTSEYAEITADSEEAAKALALANDLWETEEDIDFKIISVETI